MVANLEGRRKSHLPDTNRYPFRPLPVVLEEPLTPNDFAGYAHLRQKSPVPLAASPNAAYLEMHAFGLERFMSHAFEIDQGYAVAPDRHGHGIEFDFKGLKQFIVTS